MPMDSVTQENVEQILKEKGEAEAELAALLATSLEAMWSVELNNLSKEYDAYKLKRERIQSGAVGTTAKPTSAKGGGGVKKVVKAK